MRTTSDPDPRQLRDHLARLAHPETEWRVLEHAPVAELLSQAEELLAALQQVRAGAPEAEGQVRGREEGRAARGHEPRTPARDEEEIRASLALWLDATRRVPILRRLADSPEGDRWLDLVLEICGAIEFTLGALFRQRLEADPDRVWLRIIREGTMTEVSLGEVGARVESFARGLHSLFAARPDGQPVAMLAENSPPGMIADLACLTSGIVNTTIPADSTGDQAAYILEQVEAQVLLVGGTRQLEKVLPHLPALPLLRWIVPLADPADAAPGWKVDEQSLAPPPGSAARILPVRDLIERGWDLDPAEYQRRKELVRFEDAATVMYTSGTTGLPKGIVFTHRNLVFKRFARALALPEIGEEDHFLCYLPLYHTFGRWLEMTGTLFWGATYTFAENPSVEALLDNFQRAAPTVFISIPKKWIQLADRVRLEAVEGAGPRALRAAVERVAGGRLRWGLSAAGYLDPAVFRLWQSARVELMSGFGMTEATGGITMTPPRDYREGTVGRALPGVEVRREEDGELVVRGPYIMQGYFGSDEARVDYRREWFHTGDLVSMDEDGYITIVDRKKDIYKNVKGQTIAPQRIESLFQPFAEIRQVFLAGDGREYNTVLLYPDYDHRTPALAEMDAEQLREYLGSIIVSVNGFLAPFERILDFAVLPRALSEEHEELTPKLTYRRKVVEEHFHELIERMYQAKAARLSAGEVVVRLPHWWLRDAGLTLLEVTAYPGGLHLPRWNRRLAVEREPGSDRIRLGDLMYEGPEGEVDLEAILRAPELWLGNHELIAFTGPLAVRRPRARWDEVAGGGMRVAGIARTPRFSEDDRARLEDALWRDDRSLFTLHLTAAALLSADEKEGLRLVAYLETLAAEEGSLRASLARVALRRTVGHPLAAVRSAAFRALLPHGSPEMVGPTMTAFLRVDPAVLNQAGARALTRRGLREEVMAAFLAFLGAVRRERHEQKPALRRGGRGATPFDHGAFAGADPLRPGEETPDSARASRAVAKRKSAWDEPRTISLLRFLVVYAADHPAWFKPARAELTRWLLSGETEKVREFARRGLDTLTEGFRSWLGPDPRLAIDPASGREYDWRHVLRFDPQCDVEDRARIQKALSAAPVIKEAIFVLAGGVRISLAEIPEGGVRVRHLGTRHGKSVYHLAIHTRNAGDYDVALNVARDLPLGEMEAEVLWLNHLSAQGRPLVEELGGYWPQHGLWTEEYVPGETVSALLDRVLGAEPAVDERRAHALWIHLAASAAAAYIEFWNRTDRDLVPGDPGPENLIVPAHDYQEGYRLVAITERVSFAGFPQFLRSLKEGLFDAVAARYPSLAGVAGPEILYAAAIDVLGEDEGASLLESMLEDPATLERELPGEEAAIRAFLDRVRAGGHLPKRLAAAVARYHRWAESNTYAAPTARARMLADLWESYGLRSIEEARPETRLRFFAETVFTAASPALRGELTRLIDLARGGALGFDRLLHEMSEAVARIFPSEEEAYHLARMTYSHLRPSETAELALVTQGGARISDLVVTHRDRAGRYFRVRHAASPREVWALYNLFASAGIQIRFRSEHQFLLALDEGNKVLGGLAYRRQEADTVHMEKIVVAPTHRRQGISEELMEDFFQRLRIRGVRAVTTGFFRPQYFRRFHFRVDRQHAGLVRMLDEGPGA